MQSNTPSATALQQARHRIQRPNPRIPAAVRILDWRTALAARGGRVNHLRLEQMQEAMQ